MSTLIPAQRQSVEGRVHDRIDQLTKPYVTHEQRDTHERRPDGSWGRVVVPHSVKHKSLLDQLDDVVLSASGSTDRGSFESRPACRLDGVDLVARIDTESVWWLKRVTRADPTPSTARNLRILAGQVATLQHQELHAFDRDVRSWWTAARIVTAWDAPAWRIYAPCPLCNSWGNLYAKHLPLSAWCSACQEAWDESNIGLLGDHVRLVNNDLEGMIGA